jgi:hypothetical protein
MTTDFCNLIGPSTFFVLHFAPALQPAPLLPMPNEQSGAQMPSFFPEWRELTGNAIYKTSKATS